MLESRNLFVQEQDSCPFKLWLDFLFAFLVFMEVMFAGLAI